MPLPDRIDRLRAHFRRTPSPSSGPASPPAAFNPAQRDPPHLVAPPQPFRPQTAHATSSSPDAAGNDLSLRRSNSASSRFSQAPTIHDGMTPRIGDLVGGEGRSREQSMRNAAGEFGERFHQIVMLKQFVLWKQGRSETDERRTLSRRDVIERCQTSLVGVKDVMVEFDSANRVRPLILIEPRLSDITDDLEQYSHTRLCADIAFSPNAVVRLDSSVGVGGEILLPPPRTASEVVLPAAVSSPSPSSSPRPCPVPGSNSLRACSAPRYRRGGGQTCRRGRAGGRGRGTLRRWRRRI